MVSADSEPGGWLGHTTPDLALVVPCFNEVRRVKVDDFAELFERDGVVLVLVDDGSTDGTLTLLRDIQRRNPGRVEVLELSVNAGKAAAVSAGLRSAIGGGATWVGFLDADLAVPPDEVLRLADRRADGIDVILGSRVRLLGRRIDRSPSRHIIGRVFATFASQLLELAVYDTQCGAKLLRVTPALQAALDDPFVTRWLFDVELLARLIYPAPPADGVSPERMVEVPLRAWYDVPGGALSPASGPAVLHQAWALTRDVRRRRRAHRELGLPRPSPNR